MSSFDVDDPFMSQIHQAQQQQQLQQQKTAATSAPLKKPPKWLRRPCGATFAVSCHDLAHTWVQNLFNDVHHNSIEWRTVFFLLHTCNDQFCWIFDVQHTCTSASLHIKGFQKVSSLQQCFSLLVWWKADNFWVFKRITV